MLSSPPHLPRTATEPVPDAAHSPYRLTGGHGLKAKDDLSYSAQLTEVRLTNVLDVVATTSFAAPFVDRRSLEQLMTYSSVHQVRLIDLCPEL